MVKNEADIIAQMLRAATTWCDCVYVLDNGSSDGTWQEVCTIAKQNSRVVPDRQDQRPFCDEMRWDIFVRYKSEASSEDWWCILDADEFYIDNPRDFLSNVPSAYKSVWMQIYTYLFTESDWEAYKLNPKLYHNTPIEERLRYYVIGEYSELRFFRHSDRLASFLSGAYPIYPKRIRMKHFAYRSPQQIQLRLETRREPMGRGEFVHEKRSNWVQDGFAVPGPALPHELPQSWEERVTPTSGCYYDSRDGNYPEPGYWAPPKAPAHTSGFGRRVQRLIKRAWRAAASLRSILRS